MMRLFLQLLTGVTGCSYMVHSLLKYRLLTSKHSPQREVLLMGSSLSHWYEHISFPETGFSPK